MVEAAARAETSDLRGVIELARKQLKALEEAIPSARNVAVLPLMKSLAAIPPEAEDARITIVDGLGKTREPLALKALTLVAGARSKEVRRAVAAALGQIRHSLSAYLLLPYLEDGSSRVRNAAVHSLIVTEPPYCVEAIVLACCRSQTMLRTTCETLQQMKAFQRDRFSRDLNRLSLPLSPESIAVRRSLQDSCETEDVRLADPSKSSASLPRPEPSESQRPASASEASNGKSVGLSPLRNVASAAKDLFEELPKDAPTQSGFHTINDAESELQAASESMLTQLMSSDSDANIPSAREMLAASDTQNSLRQSSDSFANQSFFENMPLDQESSSYSAHLLPTPHFADTSGVLPGGSAANHSSSYAGLPVANQSRSSFGSVPAYSAPSQQSIGSASDNSGYGQNGGSNSSILSMAPDFSGVHRPQAAAPQPSPPAPVLPPAPSVGAFVPAFAAPPGLMAMPAPTPVPGSTSLGSGVVSLSFDSASDNSNSHATLQNSTSGTAVQDVPHSVVIHVSETAVTTTDTLSDTASPESTAAEIARALQERNLERLREMRDMVFKALLETRVAVTGPTPRILSRKISTLLATPATDLPKVRQNLLVLGDTGSAHALETINSFSQKPSKEIRLACAEALGFIRTPSSALQLLKFLSDKSGTVTEGAVKSLGKLGQPELHPVLLAAGLINTSLKTIVLASVESSTDEEKTVWEQSLLKFAGSKDGDLAALAISLLSRISGATHTEVFEKTFTCKEAVVRAASIEALVRTGKKRVIGLINEGLEDADPAVRRQAAAALVTMCSPRSVELLSQLLVDPDLSVRRTAAVTAGKIDEPDLGKAVVHALEQESDPVAVEALLEALQRNAGTDGHAVLIRYVEGETKMFRESALKALRKLKTPQTVPLFRRLLDDSSAAIRKQCVEQLTSMKVTAVLPQLRDLLRADSDEHVRAACTKAIGEMQDKSALPLLEEALGDTSIVRLQAVIALGKIGNHAAGPVLLDLLRDSQPEIRYQAVRAIGILKLEGTEEQIEAVFQDKDQMVRRGAEQTLQELGMTLGQIRRRRMQRQFVAKLSKLSPNVIAGAIPGGVKSLFAILILAASLGGFWAFSSLVSHAGGGEQLPLTSVMGVSVSPKFEQAYILRNMDILDVWSLSDTTLTKRLRIPSGITQVIPEQSGTLLLVHPSEGIRQLDPKLGFSPDDAKLVAIEGPLAALFLETHTNSLCLFETPAAGAQLRILDAATLEEKSKVLLSVPFKGNCIVSPDLKYAAMLQTNGALTLLETASGDIVEGDVAKMAKLPKLDLVFAMQFSADMKYFCFGGLQGFFAIQISNLSLVKHVKDAGSCGFILAMPGGSDVVALMGGSLLKFKDEFQTISSVEIPTLSSFNYLDSEVKMVISATEEEKDVQVFDLTSESSIQLPPKQ